MTAKRRILVTSALPYANGPLHLGHLVETIQTDIWVRFQKLRGHECIYVCADDTHGTPIMLRAQSEGITPEELIARVAIEHKADLDAFNIGFDNYHSTHSEESRELTYRTYEALERAGHIERRMVRQAYDEQAQMFLPDRFVKGTCPRCNSANQYGDSCENCGATYATSDLKDPVSVVSGTTPVERESEHLFFKLANFESMLREWTRSGTLQTSVTNKLDEWFATGLRDWDISRDAPYFGFEIPDAPGKFFYVWLDAPVGYMASFLNLCRKQSWGFEAWWKPGSPTELYHFIGKDILYFHSLFWPAVLQGAGFRTPSGIFVHGFLTINGEKMSKSRGTFITASSWREHLPTEPLRYFFASRLGSGLDDLDLGLDDFVSKVNSDIVGKLVNIASRCAGFLSRSFDNRLAIKLPDPDLYEQFIRKLPDIAEAYESRDFAAAMRDIMALADKANLYIDQHKPWLLAKDTDRASDVHGVCTQAINLFRVLILLLKPVLPQLVAKAEAFLGGTELEWDDVQRPLLGSKIDNYEPLATRIDPAAVKSLVAVNQQVVASSTPASTNNVVKVESSKSVANNEASIDDFAKLDLRIAKITNAELVDGADKLLKLTVDLGTELGTRTIFAGIRSAYEPAQLIGRLTLVFANLKPRKMRFGVSEGMMLAAGSDTKAGDKSATKEIFILSPDSGAVPGMKVK
ncbi:MAG: methionine--tRNA ligase [Steroidobacteraceae bacterium]